MSTLSQFAIEDTFVGISPQKTMNYINFCAYTPLAMKIRYLISLKANE